MIWKTENSQINTKKSHKNSYYLSVQFYYWYFHIQYHGGEREITYMPVDRFCFILCSVLLKIHQWRFENLPKSSLRLHMLKISHYNTFYALRYAHMRYVKSLFRHTGKTRPRTLRRPRTQDPRRSQDPRRTQNPTRTQDPRRTQDPSGTQDSTRTEDLYYTSC